MTEYERAKKQIEDIILNWKTSLDEKMTQILSLVEIRADDQSLPPNPYFDMADAMKGIASPQYCHAQRAREDMLKPDSEGRRFIKVIPKGR